MDDSRIRSLIAELDEAVPREGATVRIVQYGGGPDESYAVGNERGYLRLGIEFLRAAYAPEQENASRAVDVDVSYVLDPHAEVAVDWLERREDVQMGIGPSARAATWKDRIAPIVMASFLALFVFSSVVGFITLVRWLASW